MSKVVNDKVRLFDSGATRSAEEGKLDFEGFLSPVVLKRYAEYMNKHRTQPDGSVRPSDNWQKGIPLDSYMKSMLRHVMDVWLHHRGYGHMAEEPLEDALSALTFNALGYRFEKEKEVAA